MSVNMHDIVFVNEGLIINAISFFLLQKTL